MLMKYMPRRNRGNVLITSRNPEMRLIVGPGGFYEVKEMDRDDAILLLLKAASIEESSPELEKVAREMVIELCCLPLAVDQAGGAITSGLCDMQNYLAMYAKHRQWMMSNSLFK